MEPSSYEHPFQARSSSPDISASLFEYASVRAKLPEHVRAPLDVLREEVLAICTAHGVNHPTKLGREGKEPTIETLEHVSKLLEDIAYIFTHRDLPPKEKRDVDDKEYEVTLPDDTEGDVTVFDIKGRFIFATNDTTPIRIYDQDGNEELLEDEAEDVSFAYLGEELVIIEETPGMENAYRKNDPHAPWKYASGFQKTGKHISAVITIDQKTESPLLHPVGEDGEIHEEIAFKDDFLDDRNEYPVLKEVKYVGKTPYFISQADDTRKRLISTAEGTSVGNPNGYDECPLFCERNGQANFVFVDEKEHVLFIMDDRGEAFEKILFPAEVAGITHVLFVNNAYVFTGLLKNRNSVLFNEQGKILWEREAVGGWFPGKNEFVLDLVPCGPTFYLKTKITISYSSGGEENSIYYYDQNGKQFGSYKTAELLRTDTPDPIFVGGSFAFVESSLKSRLYIKHGTNAATPKTWVDIFALEQIDEYRFYVIGKEEIAEGTYRIAKRVYDTRTLEPLVRRRKRNPNPQTTP